MESFSFSTEHLPARQQFDAYRGWMGPVAETLRDDAATNGFNARYTVWNIGGLSVSSISSPATGLSRAPMHMRLHPVDHWVLMLCPEGPSGLESTRGQFGAPAGSRVPCLFSMASPVELRHPAHHPLTDDWLGDRLALFLPRDPFSDAVAAQLDLAAGTMLDRPIGRLLGDFLVSLVRELPVMSAEKAPFVAAAIRSLMACIRNPSAETLAEARPHIALLLQQRAREIVQRNLCSPDLSIDMLCRELGIRRSSLYLLFEQQGGVARYVRRARLRAARQALAEPGCGPIASVAAAFCFSSAAAFSRDFKAAFGYSPSDVRDAGPDFWLAAQRRTSAAEPTAFGLRDVLAAA